jgi:hypothetical protein
MEHHPTPAITEVLRAKRDDILRLAEQHGASNVRVFGSVVRNEATDTSDVDFLVTWDYARISSWGGVGLNLALAELLGREVDVVGDDELHWFIRDRVLAEAVPL